MARRAAQWVGTRLAAECPTAVLLPYLYYDMPTFYTHTHSQSNGCVIEFCGSYHCTTHRDPELCILFEPGEPFVSSGSCTRDNWYCETKIPFPMSETGNVLRNGWGAVWSRRPNILCLRLDSCRRIVINIYGSVYMERSARFALRSGFLACGPKYLQFLEN
jgi:hypothetical protein